MFLNLPGKKKIVNVWGKLTLFLPCNVGKKIYTIKLLKEKKVSEH